MSRYLASFYHLLISLAVFAVLAYVILFVWYPGFFYEIDGGWEGMRIIIAVDLVLGPLLTLVVFKAGKPGLKLDLAAIGTFQALCLIGGMYIVYTERPLAMVYYDGHFYSTSADTFDRYKQPVPDLTDMASPAFVFTQLSEDPIERADYIAERYRSGSPAWIMAENYVPLAPHMDEVMADAFPVDVIREEDLEGEFDRWLAREGGEADDYAYFPLRARYRDGFITIKKDTREFVSLLEIPAPLWR